MSKEISELNLPADVKYAKDHEIMPVWKVI